MCAIAKPGLKPLTNPGFDYSILSKFRIRLLTGRMEQKLLNILFLYLKESGLLKTHRRQRPKFFCQHLITKKVGSIHGSLVRF
ncbi:hypothetical protein NUACC26_049750 [Scytonema sp. NUACC26]